MIESNNNNNNNNNNNGQPQGCALVLVFGSCQFTFVLGQQGHFKFLFSPWMLHRFLGFPSFSFLFFKFRLVLLSSVQYFGQLKINTYMYTLACPPCWPNLCTSVKSCMSDGIHIIVGTLIKAGQTIGNAVNYLHNEMKKVRISSL